MNFTMSVITALILGFAIGRIRSLGRNGGAK